jgi:hypothetical protein
VIKILTGHSCSSDWVDIKRYRILFGKTLEISRKKVGDNNMDLTVLRYFPTSYRKQGLK